MHSQCICLRSCCAGTCSCCRGIRWPLTSGPWGVSSRRCGATARSSPARTMSSSSTSSFPSSAGPRLEPSCARHALLLFSSYSPSLCVSVCFCLFSVLSSCTPPSASTVRVCGPQLAYTQSAVWCVAGRDAVDHQRALSRLSHVAAGLAQGTRRPVQQRILIQLGVF